MTKLEKLRSYLGEPLFATLAILLFSHVWSFSKLADFMHITSKDILTLLEVLLAAGFALWIGLFFLSSTAFGRWLSDKGELEDIDNTYINAVLVFFIACMGCLISTYLNSNHVVVQNIILWLVLVAGFTVPSLLTNTRGLLKLHGIYTKHSEKIRTIDSKISNER